MPQNKTILIADDDELICDLLTFVLEDNGNKVITAHTIDSILHNINEKKPDLTLLDLTLGDRSGTEVLEKIKDTDMPVIVLSGFDSKYISESGITKYKCVKDFLTKPVSPDTVAESVKKILSD